MSRGISIILPVFNEQDWIGRSLKYLDEAVAESDFKTECIVVDDGSNDESASIAEGFKTSTDRLKIRVIRQKNKGRYLARKTGVEEAKFESILFIDSRVFINKKALKFLQSRLQKNGDFQVWNAHVNVAKKGNVFARFWDAIVLVAWRRYFANPRETSYGLAEFDYFPKGTTCFFVPTKLFKEALADFEKHNKAEKFSNDDTVLIRYIAGKTPIHIAPQFSCTYNARATFKKFLKHAYHRGQVFVDGFLKPGNRFFYPLIAFLLLCVGLVFSIIIWPFVMVKLLLAGVILMIVGLFFGGLIFKLDWRDSLTLAALSPFFAVVYGAGIWRAALRKWGVWA
ncbi:MAG TPA: glycosyltransferase family 2 protein [Candidatus Saccharimonadales bacterium]|nr:glycosyltransferase family 2 protein [Candidatus Saccharimonadales bacterium]